MKEACVLYQIYGYEKVQYRQCTVTLISCLGPASVDILRQSSIFYNPKQNKL